MKPKVVLVTGCSSGFGKAIAERLAARGDIVYGTLRSAPPERAAVRYLQLDVTDDAAVARGVEQILKEEGRIDALVNNAGFGISGALEDATVDELRRQLDTNLFGVHRMVRAVLPAMRKQGAGRIVNMGSLGGLIGVPFQGVYCTSKFALEAYSETLRMEVKAFGVHVSVIEPGDFATQGTANRQWVAATTGSAYEDHCRRAVARMALDEQKTKDLSPVVNAVLHVIDTAKPGLRYRVATPVQRFLVGLAYVLPQRWFEKLLLDTYK